MKKQSMVAIALVLIMVCAAGCSSFYSGRRTSMVDESTQFSGKVLNYALEPTIEVGGQVQATAEYTKFLGIWIEGDKGVMDGFSWKARTVGADPADARLSDPLLVAVRDEATYAACRDNDVEFLVAPKYDIYMTDYFFYKYVKATVTGFAGRYKNFKSLSLDEAQKRLRDEAITNAINRGDLGKAKIEIPLDSLKSK